MARTTRRLVCGLLTLLLGCAPAARPDRPAVDGEAPVAPRATEGPTSAFTASPRYKGGEGWPLRNFRGLDLLEPILPLVSVRQGDPGRLVLGTVLPVGLLAAACSIPPRQDDHSVRELSDNHWLSVDQSQDNVPLQWTAVAIALGTAFLPDPDQDRRGYEWRLRLDRLTVLGVGLATVGLEVALLKPAFDRERPDGKAGSRPSGHAAVSFAAMTFASNVLRETLEPWEEEALGPRLLKEAACALPYLGATYIALSRVHAERHYLTDVLLGAALGSLTMQLFYSWSFLREELEWGLLDAVGARWDPDRQGLALELVGRF